MLWVLNCCKKIFATLFARAKLVKSVLVLYKTMSSAPGGGVLRLLLLTFQTFYRELILYIKIHETFNRAIKLTISANLKVNKRTKVKSRSLQSIELIDVRA